MTALPLSDCKHANIIPTTTEKPVTHHGMLLSQNETMNLQKNMTDSAIVVKQNEPAVVKHNEPAVVKQNEHVVVKHDRLETHRNPKTRQAPPPVPVQTSSYSSPAMEGDLNAEHSFYHSPLMVYPFPMMNTYYPRYFPYTYPGYQGHPFFG